MSKTQKNIMKYTFILSIFISILGCNTILAEEFKITGNIKNKKSDILYLEKISFDKIILVDSVILQNDNNFKFSSNINQLGLYRIRFNTEQNTSWILSIEPQENITVSLDGNNILNSTIKGSANQNEFQLMVKSLNTQQGEMMQLHQQYQSVSKSNPNSKDQQAIAKLLDTKNKNFFQFIDNSIIKSKNIMSKYFIYSILLQQAQQSGVNDVLEKKIKDFTKELDKKLPNSDYFNDFNKIVQSIENQKNSQRSQDEKDKVLAVGNVAPDIELVDKDDKKYKLSDFKGKVVLLDFWASWCRPCRMENPNVLAAYNKFKDKGFVVLSISQDQDLNKWQLAINQDKLYWNTHFADMKTQGSASNLYDIQFIPKTYLIGKDGSIVAKDLRGESLELKLSEIFK